MKREFNNRTFLVYILCFCSSSNKMAESGYKQDQLKTLWCFPCLEQLTHWAETHWAKKLDSIHIQQQIRLKKLETLDHIGTIYIFDHFFTFGFFFNKCSRKKSRFSRIFQSSPTTSFLHVLDPPDHCQRLSSFYPVCFCCVFLVQTGQSQDIGVFLLFGAANTLGFLHVSETLDHIGTI